jgi:tetratricopeptide (TPR) repeat protein
MSCNTGACFAAWLIVIALAGFPLVAVLAWIGKRRVGNLPLFEATQNAHAAISIALRLNSELAEAQTSLGLCVLGAGEQRVAAAQFTKAIELDPDNVDAYLQRANLLRNQG